MLWSSIFVIHLYTLQQVINTFGGQESGHIDTIICIYSLTLFLMAGMESKPHDHKGGSIA